MFIKFKRAERRMLSFSSITNVQARCSDMAHVEDQVQKIQQPRSLIFKVLKTLLMYTVYMSQFIQYIFVTYSAWEPAYPKLCLSYACQVSCTRQIRILRTPF